MALLLIVLMDPLGNLPVFVSMLRHKTEEEYRRIVLRESVFAFLCMVGAVLLGGMIMRQLHITGARLGLAGGLILLLIGIGMVFSTFKPPADDEAVKDPYIVPLAVPLICGPGLVAVLITLRDSPVTIVIALTVAWSCQMLILLCGKKIARFLGSKPLDALESLMGLLLTGISIGMILDNIKLEFS